MWTAWLIKVSIFHFVGSLVSHRPTRRHILHYTLNDRCLWLELKSKETIQGSWGASDSDDELEEVESSSLEDESSDPEVSESHALKLDVESPELD